MRVRMRPALERACCLKRSESVDACCSFIASLSCERRCEETILCGISSCRDARALRLSESSTRSLAWVRVRVRVEGEGEGEGEGSPVVRELEPRPCHVRLLDADQLLQLSHLV